MAALHGVNGETVLRHISDPHCSTESWWSGAAAYPIEAMRSPLFPLLTLEAPERWLQLWESKQHTHLWIERYVKRLTESAGWRVSSRAIERAWWIFSVRYPVHPDRAVLLEVIEARRRRDTVAISGSEWQQIKSGDILREWMTYYLREAMIHPTPRDALSCIRAAISAIEGNVEHVNEPHRQWLDIRYELVAQITYEQENS